MQATLGVLGGRRRLNIVSCTKDPTSVPVLDMVLTVFKGFPGHKKKIQIFGPWETEGLFPMSFHCGC